MYPQGDPSYVRVGVPDKLRSSFKQRLIKLDPEWSEKVYYLKAQGVIPVDKKSYGYTVYSVPARLEQKLGLLFRIRRWLWEATRNTGFL